MLPSTIAVEVVTVEAVQELIAARRYATPAVAVTAAPTTVAEFTAAGAVRISLGSAIAQAAYAVAARAAAELLANGTYDSCADALPYGDFNAAFQKG